MMAFFFWLLIALSFTYGISGLRLYLVFTANSNILSLF